MKNDSSNDSGGALGTNPLNNQSSMWPVTPDVLKVEKFDPEDSVTRTDKRPGPGKTYGWKPFEPFNPEAQEVDNNQKNTTEIMPIIKKKKEKTLGKNSGYIKAKKSAALDGKENDEPLKPKHKAKEDHEKIETGQRKVTPTQKTRKKTFLKLVPAGSRSKGRSSNHRHKR